jgi:hypothetical protein
LRNSYLKSRALNTRGVDGKNWLAVFWWEGLELHVVLLRLNGIVTAEEHYVISHNWKQQKSEEEKRSRPKIDLSSGCLDAEFFKLLCHLKEDYDLECKIVMRNGKLQMTMVKTMEAPAIPA